ncbi:hypothetical protein CMO96_01510 [Candidatus Woesebacteria bacterium]|nr:hypothetical protein [Candidatus Woesebacteria bacterium]
MTISSDARVKFLSLLFLVVGALLLARLFSWQVLRSDELTELARGQHQISRAIPAIRGSILASDGFPLAAPAEAWLVWASLPDIEDSRKVAAHLAPILAPKPTPIEEEATESAIPTEKELILAEEERLKEILTKEGVVWVPLKHRVTRETKEEIYSLGLSGIGFDLEESRSYPEGTMAAQLLGFVGKDAAGEDKGYFGLEGYYDLTLSGTRGVKAWEKDAFGNPILLGISRNISSANGLSLQTHIDRSVQWTLEKNLEKGIERYGAVAGSVVVMNPKDGGVLGMASWPSYDPSRFTSFEEEDFASPVVGDSFEPGSIFKVLVMAGALDKEVIKEDSKCDICEGPKRVAEYTISTWDNTYYPDSTPTEIIQHSDNVGMVWVAESLGIEALLDYLERFGIGKTTSIDLQGEANPKLRSEADWTTVDLATAGFGQGVAVTPIQMVTAVAGIANEGRVPVPQVVDKVIGVGWEQDIKPQFQGQAISSGAARKITEMMINAVESGEAQWTRLRGFQVAGKTGTAQIAVRGHYDEEKTIASFVGFAPADDPKFVMLVTLREPQSSPWASETAAPLWFSIANDLFPYFGIQPK